MKKSELKKLIKESVLKLRRESVNDELNSVKGDSIDNQIKKAEALLKILKSEGLAYRALGKEAMAQYKEHDYEKLKAEAIVVILMSGNIGVS